MSNSKLRDSAGTLLLLVVAVFIGLWYVSDSSNSPVFGSSAQAIWFVGAFSLLTYLTIHLYTSNMFLAYVVGIIVFIITLKTVCGIA